jgi:hypothetical protein
VRVCLCCVVCAAVLVSTLLDPKAETTGSGMPLLKYILSGDMMEDADERLQPRQLAAKVRTRGSGCTMLSVDAIRANGRCCRVALMMTEVGLVCGRCWA